MPNNTHHTGLTSRSRSYHTRHTPPIKRTKRNQRRWRSGRACAGSIRKALPYPFRTATIALYATAPPLFAFAAPTISRQKGRAFQASSPKTFQGRSFDRPFFCHRPGLGSLSPMPGHEKILQERSRRSDRQARHGWGMERVAALSPRFSYSARAISSRP